jgi:hypothetical protein
MKTIILQKIEALKKAKENYLVQINAINGALQLAEELLKEAEKEGETDGKNSN